ncbi:MAG: peptide chain release factor 1 [Candidatus Spechtbacterales bacterium]
MDEKIKNLKKEYEEISEKLSSQEVISDPQKLQELSIRHSELQPVIDLYDRITVLGEKIAENEKIVKEGEDEEFVALVKDELENHINEKSKLDKKLDEILNPKPGSRVKEAVVEIRAGVGGDEAALFAQSLFAMYSRYAALNGWQVTLLEESRNELGGLKEATFEIRGDGVYLKLRNESGVHRVQRVPETEKSGRLHTSSASVAVLPKAKPVDIEIKPEDVKFEAFRSSGPGGQNVNKVATAVRITHLPTGIAVASQVHKKQVQNREAAMTILRSKLLKQKEEEEARKIKEERKEQIGSGDRSEKIRTYNFPQDRITDHRISKSWHGIEKIMAGHLDPIVDEIQNI